MVDAGKAITLGLQSTVWLCGAVGPRGSIGEGIHSILICGWICLNAATWQWWASRGRDVTVGQSGVIDPSAVGGFSH